MTANDQGLGSGCDSKSTRSADLNPDWDPDTNPDGKIVPQKSLFLEPERPLLGFMRTEFIHVI